jgi:hypothetical protein
VSSVPIRMSSPTPRQSGDTFASPISASTPREFPFPQHSFSQRPSSSHQRHPSRRGSTASSITSIGGMLDASQPRTGSIAESGQNGTGMDPPIKSCKLTALFKLYPPSCNLPLSEQASFRTRPYRLREVINNRPLETSPLSR